MSFRRKAPAAKTLSPAQQLSKLCNAYPSDSVFQSHNAMALLTQLHKHDRPQYDQFVKSAAAQRFVPSWAAELSGEKITATKYTLPLPTQYISGEDSAADLEPRTFYLEKDVSHLVGKPSKSQAAPRCGHSGLFFAREEVVDNLHAAASALGFSSPFWIRTEHPGLKSGFLVVKEGSESIVISLTASVIAFGDVEAVDEHKFHPLVRGLLKSRNGDGKSPLAVPESIPKGMNAITGATTINPFVCGLPHRGLWLSQDQLLHNNIKLSPRIKQASRAFSLVEIEQWELFNADQLQVPGRLGLRKSLDFKPGQSVFEPV